MEKPFRLEFLEDAPIGFRFTYKGQVSEVISSDPWTRKDGEPSRLLTWESNCVACGSCFTQKTGKNLTGFIRRCGDCKSEGVKIKKWRPAR